MRFTVDGVEYRIAFKRVHDQVKYFDHVNGVEVVRPSTYPSTIVTIYKGQDVFRTDSVKCHHSEKFGPHRNLKEQGRLLALRKISATLDKEFKAAMWQAYVNRNKKVKPVELPSAPLETL